MGIVEATDQGHGDVSQFTEIDLTPDARFFVDFMDVANAQPDRRRLKSVLTERLRLAPGTRLLDVGCGTGDDSRTLASLVVPEGQVIGMPSHGSRAALMRPTSPNGGSHWMKPRPAASSWQRC